MKKILVTGSTDGIGKQTAIQIAKKGFDVIVHGRTEAKAQEAAEEISRTAGRDCLYVFADFGSLSEVENMSRQVKGLADSLDVLVNNAGIYMTEFQKSKDGMELTMAVNHFAPYALTGWLLSLFSLDARVVNVSSVAHTRGHIDFEQWNLRENFDGYKAYADSKLANVLFTYYLDRNFGAEVKSNCLHPGVISTKLLHKGFGMGGEDPSQGAENSVYLATSEKVEGVGGKYFVGLEAAQSSEESYNQEVQEKLWQLSEKLTGVKYEKL